MTTQNKPSSPPFIEEKRCLFSEFLYLLFPCLNFKSKENKIPLYSHLFMIIPFHIYIHIFCNVRGTSLFHVFLLWLCHITITGRKTESTIKFIAQFLGNLIFVRSRTPHFLLHATTNPQKQGCLERWHASSTHILTLHWLLTTFNVNFVNLQNRGQ